MSGDKCQRELFSSRQPGRCRHFAANPSREFTSLQQLFVSKWTRALLLVSNPSREFTSLRRVGSRRFASRIILVSNPSREFTSLRRVSVDNFLPILAWFQTPRGNSLHFDELWAAANGQGSSTFQTPRGNSLHFDGIVYRA